MLRRVLGLPPRTIVRRARPRDEARLLDYLDQDPYYNLFLTGDILNYGVSGRGVEVYWQRRGSEIEAVLLRCHFAMIFCAHDLVRDLGPTGRTVSGLLARGGTWMISARREAADALLPHVTTAPAAVGDHLFALCREPRAQVSLDALPLVRAAEPREAAEVNALLDTIPEFTGPRTPVRTLQQEIAARRTMIALVRDAASGRLIASATREAETDRGAMITSVATRPDCRRRGYASACVHFLARDLHRRGKAACLFFTNPAAGAIYRRLGFEEIGGWKVMKYVAG